MSNSLLLVDDNLTFLETLRDFLKSSGYVVETASSLEAGLQAVERRHFDLVVTDLVFEGAEGGGLGSGIDLIKTIKAKGQSPSIMVLSGYASRYSDQLAELGVEVVSKGEVGSSHLIDLVERALKYGRRPRASPAEERRESHENSILLNNIRQIFSEEAARLIQLKETRLAIPGQGDYELLRPLIGFKRELERKLVRFPFATNVFLMMKFRAHTRDIADYLKDILSRHGLTGVRADDPEWNITNSAYNPVAVLYCCKYGIALFDEREEDHTYSPNVAYELGMMHQQGKSCLILRHSSLPGPPFDLVKDLYKPYDRDLQLGRLVEEWIGQLDEAV